MGVVHDKWECGEALRPINVQRLTLFGFVFLLVLDITYVFLVLRCFSLLFVPSRLMTLGLAAVGLAV